MNQIIIRDGKGKKDRITMLPQKIKEALRKHLIHVQRIHQKDLRKGYGKVFLPYALAVKFPNAAASWGVAICLPVEILIKGSSLRPCSMPSCPSKQYSQSY